MTYEKVYDIELDVVKSTAWRKYALIVTLVVWVVVSLQTLVCLCPILYGTSMWMPVVKLHLEEAKGSQWLNALEESLHLFASISNDLNGHTTFHDNRLASVSSNRYTFDFASWCRQNSAAKSVVCYRGNGLDIISSFVIDFGAQVGELGNSEDPTLFGRDLEATYRKTIEDIDNLYITSKESGDSDIDFDRLKTIHHLRKSRTIGYALWILKVIHVNMAIIFLGLKFTSIISHFGNTFRFMALLLSVHVVCQLCTFSIVLCEAVFAAIINSQLFSYGVHLQFGLAYYILMVEFTMGALLVYQTICY